MVVVLGIAETEVRRGVHVVEFAHGPDGREPRQIEMTRTKALFSAHPAFQILDEIPLVEHVVRLFKGADAFADLDDGRHRGDGMDRGRGVRPVLGGQFERDIPAE